MRKDQKNDVEYLAEGDHVNLSDFILVATLEYFDCKYIATNKDPKFLGQRVEFVFRRTRQIEKIMESFWKDELSVEPKKFWSTVRALKARAKIY